MFTWANFAAPDERPSWSSSLDDQLSWQLTGISFLTRCKSPNMRCATHWIHFKQIFHETCHKNCNKLATIWSQSGRAQPTGTAVWKSRPFAVNGRGQCLTVPGSPSLVVEDRSITDSTMNCGTITATWTRPAKIWANTNNSIREIAFHPFLSTYLSLFGTHQHAHQALTGLSASESHCEH